jgi:signal transduction histidine kinase
LRSDDETAQADEFPANILLVGDYPANLAALETSLDPLGHKLIKASSGRQANELLTREEVAVILIDVRTQGLDGVKASELMRNGWRAQRTPVIFLTAADSDMGSVLDDCARGPVDFLPAPCAPEILRCKVSVFVDLFLKERTIRHQAAALHQQQRALAGAEAANRIKDEFLAIVSHELRNPLNAITGWVHLLNTGNLDSAKSKRALEIIERNVQLQVSLIDEILDLSRIANGKVHLTLLTVDLIPLIESALDAMRPSVEAKDLLLTWEWNGPPVCVNGDSERLHQVISNLVSNAVKFTPPSGRVSINLERDEHQATLVVSDSGKGISAEFLPFVFDMFRQADSSITRDHHGLGLKLAIARKLVELHGGRIAARSEGTDKGATFSVSLPLQASPAGDGPPDGS